MMKNFSLEELRALLERFSLNGGFVLIGVKEYGSIYSELFVARTKTREVAKELGLHSQCLQQIQRQKSLCNTDTAGKQRESTRQLAVTQLFG